jgi:hypothetical protein
VLLAKANQSLHAQQSEIVLLFLNKIKGFREIRAAVAVDFLLPEKEGWYTP